MWELQKSDNGREQSDESLQYTGRPCSRERYWIALACDVKAIKLITTRYIVPLIGESLGVLVGRGMAGSEGAAVVATGLVVSFISTILVEGAVVVVVFWASLLLDEGKIRAISSMKRNTRPPTRPRINNKATVAIKATPFLRETRGLL